MCVTASLSVSVSNTLLLLLRVRVLRKLFISPHEQPCSARAACARDLILRRLVGRLVVSQDVSRAGRGSVGGVRALCCVHLPVHV